MADPYASLNAVQDASAAAARAIADTIPTGPRPSTMWVKASDPSIPVRLSDGTTVTEQGMEVSANDVFIARRIRDGSLVRTDPVKPVAEAPAQPQAQMASGTTARAIEPKGPEEPYNR